MFVYQPAADPIEPEIVKALSEVCTSTLGHLRDYGFAKGLQPLTRPTRFVGAAVTVRIPFMDSTAVHVAVDDLRPGDVIVVEHCGDRSRSCFGGMVAYTAKTRGAAGGLFDGPVNDYDEIIAAEFPVYSRGISSHTTRQLGIEGAINVPVTVGGAIVQPGDVIWADSDGVAILAPDEALGIASVLREKEEAEIPLRKAIDEGKRLSDWSGAAAAFRAGFVSTGG
ncbi:MAG TPA: RraA family protein [Streptosporangiaceae bacterium]|nr:RraA family protein [Streptosporangiaceae bacterium]